MLTWTSELNPHEGSPEQTQRETEYLKKLMEQVKMISLIDLG